MWVFWEQDKVDFVSNPNHVVVQRNGFYYDCLNASAKLNTIPWMVSVHNTPMDIDAMCRFWIRNGFAGHELRKILKLVEKV